VKVFASILITSN